MKPRNNKLVIIGAGQIVNQMHAPAIAALGVNVVQVIEPNKINKINMGKYFPSAVMSHSLDELEGTATCALVASPTMLHEEQVTTLLERGLDVFCEKPLAVTGPGAQRLAELAKKNGRVLYVGYYRRFHPTAQVVKTYLRRGDFGTIGSVFVVGGHIDNRSGPASLYDRRLSGGGCTMDIGPHIIDRLVSWFDTVNLISYSDDEGGGGIEANSLIKLEGTINHTTTPITVLLSRTSPIGYRFAIQGEHQTLVNELNNGHQFWMVGQELSWPQGHIQPTGVLSISPPITTLNFFVRQWQDFLRQLDGGVEEISSLQGAVITSDLLGQAYTTKKLLKIPWDLQLEKPI